MHLRAREDSVASRAGENGEDNAYPQLVLTMTSTEVQPATAPSDISPSTLTLTEAQLLSHLARRGCLTDRLDHPLLFARSGLLPYNVQAINQGTGDAYCRGGDIGYNLDEHEINWHLRKNGKHVDCADVLSMREGQELVRTFRFTAAPPSSVHALDLGASSAPTLGSCLALARSILSFTPALASLSVAGFMERAICGARPPPGLRSLRCLSIGPAPSCWHLGLELSRSALTKVERIRSRCSDLYAEQVASIAGEEGALPSLTELRLTMTQGSRSVGRLREGQVASADPRSLLFLPHSTLCTAYYASPSISPNSSALPHETMISTEFPQPYKTPPLILTPPQHPHLPLSSFSSPSACPRAKRLTTAHPDMPHFTTRQKIAQC